MHTLNYYRQFRNKWQFDQLEQMKIKLMLTLYDNFGKLRINSIAKKNLIW